MHVQAPFTLLPAAASKEEEGVAASLERGQGIHAAVSGPAHATNPLQRGSAAALSILVHSSPMPTAKGKIPGSEPSTRAYQSWPFLIRFMRREGLLASLKGKRGLE
jgi:hypothetical protein